MITMVNPFIIPKQFTTTRIINEERPDPPRGIRPSFFVAS